MKILPISAKSFLVLEFVPSFKNNSFTNYYKNIIFVI